MNDIVKNCVESRKTAIFNGYDIKNQATLNKIDDFFKRLENYANNYNDAMAFESAFATSDLNKEYMELFTLIATSETPKTFTANQTENVTQTTSTTETKSDGEMFVEELADDAKHRVRREIRTEAYDKVRDIPGVGTALGIKQHIDLFGRFRKNKDK